MHAKKHPHRHEAVKHPESKHRAAEADASTRARTTEKKEMRWRGFVALALMACRKPKADQVAKRTTRIPRAKRLSHTLRYVTSRGPD